jgi:predicted histidine transporter YuiF (NhaC family)
MTDLQAIPLTALVMASPFIAGALIGELMSHRKPRTKYTTSELIARQRAKIERNSARKTTTQQTRSY